MSKNEGFFEDSCWHEAGHAVVAASFGLLTHRIIIKQTPRGEWYGFRHGAGGHPASLLAVCPAGMAGELMRKFRNPSSVTSNSLEIARSRSRDDLKKYQKYANRLGYTVSFEEYAFDQSWKQINGVQKQFNMLAEELISNGKIGPLVLAQIMNGLPITTGARDADNEYLSALEAVNPAPQPP